MEENAEVWSETDDGFKTYGWRRRDDQKATVTRAAIEEILAGSLGEGLVALHFMADADELREALAADNGLSRIRGCPVA